MAAIDVALLKAGEVDLPNAIFVAAGSVSGERPENQDNALLKFCNGSGQLETHYLQDQQWVVNEHLAAESWPPEQLRLCIFDGVGGHKGGRDASEKAAKIIADLPFSHSIDALIARLKQQHFILQEALATHGRGSKRPGTTLVLVDINIITGKSRFINIGDSRLYQRQAVQAIEHKASDPNRHSTQNKNWQWRQLTADHTPNEFAWRDGKLDDKAISQARRENQAIAQAFGFGSVGIAQDADGKKINGYHCGIRIDYPAANNSQVDVAEFHLAENDALLLATDGLWSHRMHCQPALSAFNNKPSREGLMALFEKEVTAGSTDNISAIYLCRGEPPAENNTAKKFSEPTLV